MHTRRARSWTKPARVRRFLGVARRRPRILSVLLLVVLMAGLTTPAVAIVFGEPDTENRFPNVGSIVVNVPELELELIQFCSGTLIDDDVFLTAAHCTDFLEQLADAFPRMEVLVTFDQTIDAGGTFFTGTMHTNPNFNAFRGRPGLSDPGDIAVIVLDDEPEGITPASLPEAGMLDQLNRERVLRDTRFTAVGYGTTRDSMTGGFFGIMEENLDRNFAEQSFFSLTKAWLTLAMVNTPGFDSGGTCFGDSGGPHFIHDANNEVTDTAVSITVTGDTVCVATDKTYRLDTESARSFLEVFVDLP
jgi:hypothetical protein